MLRSASDASESLRWRCVRQGLLSLLAVVQVALAPESFGQQNSRLQPEYEHLRDCVVQIRAEDDHGELNGTGFLVAPAGIIYTSFTIGGETSNIQVRIGPVVLPAQRLVADPRSGVAILKVDAQTPSLPLADGPLPAPDAPVVALGYPMGADLSSITGVVTGLDSKNNRGFFATTHLRARVPALLGMGGAPLLNTEGRVVGIVISKLDDGAGCHALPIRAAQKVHSDFLRFGELRPGWLGIEVSNNRPEQKGVPAIVDTVSAPGPAADAGLAPGDILKRIGESPIDRPVDVIDAAFFISAGDNIPVVVERDGQTMTFNIHAMPNPSVPDSNSAVDAGMAPGMHLPVGSSGRQID